MSDRRKISSRKEAIAFLKQKGTKVAVQVGVAGVYVFAEKKDFIEQILKGIYADEETFIDYDGDPVDAFIDDDILHIPTNTM
jgi:hypothetical protein